jgi:hypothetical protein
MIELRDACLGTQKAMDYPIDITATKNMVTNTERKQNAVAVVVRFDKRTSRVRAMPTLLPTPG